jgi:phosphohistidine phosphatase SixA
MTPSLTLTRRQFHWTLLACVSSETGLSRAQDGSATPDFWALLRQGGNILLMRHAQTVPVICDPPNFRLNDCSTQRNLNEAGRNQARRVAAAFQREGIELEDVRSSAWCRCVETAELAFGRHTVWSPINSFFDQGRDKRQTRDTLRSLQQRQSRGNLVLVTHQVNISALAGDFTARGEILLTRPDGTADGQLRVLARQTF